MKIYAAGVENMRAYFGVDVTGLKMVAFNLSRLFCSGKYSHPV